MPDANRLQLVRSVPRGVREYPMDTMSAALTFSILTESPTFVTTFRKGHRHGPLTRLEQVKEDHFYPRLRDERLSRSATADLTDPFLNTHWASSIWNNHPLMDLDPNNNANGRIGFGLCSIDIDVMEGGG